MKTEPTNSLDFDESWRIYVSRLLSADWENPEDARYDEDD